jgi:hypothetical protein
MYLIQENFDLKNKISELQAQIDKLETFKSDAIKIAFEIDDFCGEQLKDLERELFGYVQNSVVDSNKSAEIILSFLQQNFSEVNFIRAGNVLAINRSNCSTLNTYNFWSITVHDTGVFVCVQDDSQQEFVNPDILKSWAINGIKYLIAQKRI